VRRSPLTLVGSVVLIVVLLLGLFAPIISRADPISQSLLDRNLPPGASDAQHFVHILGTDNLGRDVLARALYGIRLSMAIGIVTMVLGGVIGGLLGLVAGYSGGRSDAFISRVVDIVLSFPYILMAIIFAAIWGGGVLPIITIIVIRGWVPYTQVTRSTVFSLKRQTFVDAARASGASTPRILLRHLLPNTVAPLLIIASFQVGTAIVLESTLSFLGLGINPPTPSLGSMLNDGRSYLATAWWPVATSGILLTAIVLAVNMLGDGIRDVADPRLR
jgi:peptide/nickel transport system permease protein